MIITNFEMGLKGIRWNRFTDIRGEFTRIWDKNTMNFFSTIEQVSVVRNLKKGTFRGMHFQTSPYVESKIVCCTKGRIMDICMNIDKNSPDFEKLYYLELSNSGNFNAIYIPKGFAHGYLTLDPNTELVYFSDNKYSPNHSKGINYRSISLKNSLIDKFKIISEQDKSLPFWNKNN